VPGLKKSQSFHVPPERAAIDAEGCCGFSPIARMILKHSKQSIF
jgi:hypothetical protein